MYKYVGPKEILKQIKLERIGHLITKKDDICKWIAETNQQIDFNDEITATFIIDLEENLRINDRRSEHVVCANGKPVLSAGEITFEVEKGKSLVVSQISNQSTGYCPAPKSWKNIDRVLSKVGIEYPEYLTTEFVFRICEKCKNINIVKDNYYVCLICNADLPEKEE